MIRVVLSGQTPLGTREQFTTTVSATWAEYMGGGHVEQAKFRAGVRGLGAPWEVLDTSTVAVLVA